MHLLRNLLEIDRAAYASFAKGSMRCCPPSSVLSEHERSEVRSTRTSCLPWIVKCTFKMMSASTSGTKRNNIEFEEEYLHLNKPVTPFCSAQTAVLKSAPKLSVCRLSCTIQNRCNSCTLSIAMLRSISILQLRQYFILVLLTISFTCPCVLFVHHSRSFHRSPETAARIRSITSYDQFCRQLDQRISLEQVSDMPVQLVSRETTIPYAYSRWRSTTLMPRALTPCEHAIYIHLLSILVERVFEKYNIPYMMMAATLLGTFQAND